MRGYLILRRWLIGLSCLSLGVGPAAHAADRPTRASKPGAQSVRKAVKPSAKSTSKQTSARKVQAVGSAQTSGPSTNVHPTQKSILQTVKTHTGRKSKISPLLRDTPVQKLQKDVEVATIQVDGSVYQILERKNEHGVTIMQLLMGPDRRDIAVDSDGDGMLESYESITGESTVTMSNPAQGAFLRMDVEHRTSRGKLLLQFAYDDRKRDYVLFATQALASPRLFRQDFLVGCKAGEDHLEDLSRKLSEALLNDSGISQLKVSLRQNLLNETCRNGAFSEMSEHLVNGIAEVASSERSGGEEPPSKKGKFLQCLRYYKLDAHAYRIGSAIAEHSGLVGNGSTGNARIRVGCSTRDAGALGSYDQPPNNAPLITMFGSKAKLDSLKPNSTPEDYKNSYATTFFHEMLHHSKIEDEDIVDAIEGCCSSEGGEDGIACKRLSRIAEAKKYAQFVEGRMIQSMGAEAYARYRDELRDSFGPRADYLNEEFHMVAGYYYADELEKPGCQSQENPGRLTDACFESFRGRYREFLSSYAYSRTSQPSRCAQEVVNQRQSNRVTIEQASGMCNRVMNHLNHALQLDFRPTDTEDAPNFCRYPESQASSSPWEYLKSVFAIEVSYAANDCEEFRRYESTGLRDYAPTASAPEVGSRQGHHLPRSTETNQTAREPVKSSSSVSNTKSRQNTGPTYQRLGDRFKQSTEYRQTVRNYVEEQTVIADRPRAQTRKMADTLSKVAFQGADAGANQSQVVSRQGRARGLDDRDQVSNPEFEKARRQMSGVRLPNPFSQMGSAGGSGQGGGGSHGNRLASISSPADYGSGGAPAKLRGFTGSGEEEGGPKGFLPNGSPQVAGMAPQAGPNSRGIASSGGLPQASSPNGEDKASADAISPELQKIIDVLTGPYPVAKKELSRPSTVGILMKHSIQVVDDKGRIYGAGRPKHKLIYSGLVGHLVLQNSSARSAASEDGR